MNKRRRVVALVVALVVPVLGVLFLLPLRRLFRPYHLPAPPPRAPLASLAIHQVQWVDESCKGVDAVLQSGYFLCDVINCDSVDGIAAGISVDAARARYGAPAGEWKDPLYGVPAYYYEVRAGRVSIGLAPDSGNGHWVTIAYPTRTACNDVVRDSRLLAQVLEIRGADNEIYFTVRPAEGAPGGLGLHLKGSTCDSLQFHGIEPSYRREPRRAAQH